MYHSSRLLGVLVIAFTGAGTVAAEPFRDPGTHFIVDLPEGWSMMPPALINNINNEVSRKAGFQGTNFYGGFWQRTADGVLRYPYVLVQVRPMVPNAFTYQEIRTTLAHDNLYKHIGLRDGPVTSIKNLALNESFVDMGGNRVIAVKEQDETVRKPKSGDKDGETETFKVRYVSVGFLGAQNIILFHYYDRADGFDKRAEPFDVMLNTFRFEENWAYKPRFTRVAAPIEIIKDAPTEAEQRKKNVLFGSGLALGLGALCALFVWRSRRGVGAVSQHSVAGEHS